MKKFWKSNRKIIKYVLKLFIVWQIALIILSFVSSKIIPEKNRFTYNDVEKNANLVFLWDRANFDGSHYLQISKNGYGQNQQVFFPLYPQVIKILTPLFFNKDLIAAIFISNVSFLIALFIYYKLLLIDFNENVVRKTLLLLVLFPASFFFGMVYTESIFLLFILGSFYSVRKQHWLLAGILGALAAYTRIVGVFIFPAILFEWWTQTRDKSLNLKVKSLLPLLFIPLGLFSYMRFLWLKYNDALMFFHVQPFFGAGINSQRIILIYQVFWRYFKMILTTRFDILYFSVWLELLIALFFLILLVLSFKNKVRISYLIFSIFAFIIPTLTGSFLSMPRFVLVMFPCFVLLGQIENKLINRILKTIFLSLFVISAVLFFRGYWVS